MNRTEASQLGKKERERKKKKKEKKEKRRKNQKLKTRIIIRYINSLKHNPIQSIHPKSNSKKQVTFQYQLTENVPQVRQRIKKGRSQQQIRRNKIKKRKKKKRGP